MKILLLCNYKPGVGGISGQVEALQRHLRAEGHEVEIFSAKGSVWQRLGMPRKLRKLLRTCDVLHIHCCSQWGFWPAVLGVDASRGLGKRTVVTYHGGGAERFFEKHHRLVHRYLSRADANIVLSGFLADIFQRHGLPHVTIPNIVDLDADHFRQRTTMLPHYICTRAHEELYNIPCLLRAFQKVQQQHPEATLTLVGGGSMHSQLQQQVNDMGLHGVTFTGRVDNSQIYSHLDRADIFVSTPKVDNMPVSLLEAMNAGLLVISSRVGGVPFIVKNGRDALLFESDNDAELAKQMLWPLDNDTIAAAITMQARRTVDRYRWQNIKDLIYNAYGIHS